MTTRNHTEAPTLRQDEELAYAEALIRRLSNLIEAALSERECTANPPAPATCWRCGTNPAPPACYPCQIEMLTEDLLTATRDDIEGIHHSLDSITQKAKATSAQHTVEAAWLRGRISEVTTDLTKHARMIHGEPAESQYTEIYRQLSSIADRLVRLEDDEPPMDKTASRDSPLDNTWHTA